MPSIFRFIARALVPLAFCLLFFATGCQPSLLEPPRAATQAARAAGTAVPTATPLTLPAPTPTGEPIQPIATPIAAVEPNPVITLWVNETSAAHKAALEEMAAEFTTQHNIDLEFVMIDADRLPVLAETAVVSGTLPDLILHPIEYSVGWAEKGILDPTAAAEVVDRLGRETFDAAALDLVAVPSRNGQPAAVPSDGWQYLILYRSDWFDALNLEPPTDFAALEAAAAAIYHSEEISAQTGVTNTLISGLVIPTESDLLSTQHIFEQMATANGCQLVDEKGEVLLLDQSCFDTLNYYRNLINRYSPSDVQTDTSALNAYLSGRTGVIFGPPTILAAVAGLDADYPPRCAQCTVDPTFLVQNSGVVTQLRGRGEAATTVNYGQLTYLGITTQADEERAAEFAAYWFRDGYLKWLAVEPERKVPMRRGTAENPQQFTDAWVELPLNNSDQTLGDIFGAETAAAVAEGIANSPRWGFSQGQGVLMESLYVDRIFSILLQELLSGYFNSQQAVVEAYNRVVDRIPNYAYYTDPRPTPTAEAEE